jgi:hypothetical protein
MHVAAHLLTYVVGAAASFPPAREKTHVCALAQAPSRACVCKKKLPHYYLHLLCVVWPPLPKLFRPVAALRRNNFCTGTPLFVVCELPRGNISCQPASESATAAFVDESGAQKDVCVPLCDGIFLAYNLTLEIILPNPVFYSRNCFSALVLHLIFYSSVSFFNNIT